MAECPNCKALAENCNRIQERASNHANACEAKLFHAWQSLRQQQKGMKRMARKIKRLQSQLKVRGAETVREAQ
jgi:hypothetical protein